MDAVRGAVFDWEATADPAHLRRLSGAFEWFNREYKAAVECANPDPGEHHPLSAGEVLGVLRQAVGEARPAVGEAAVGLVVDDTVVPVGTVTANRDALVAAVRNLVINAIEAALATTDGRPRMVSIGIENVGENLQVWVEDTGPGMPPTVLEHLDLWQHLPPSRRDPRRRGKGLFIARRIAEGHHGGVSFPRSDESGTRAVLWIPVVRRET